MENKYQLSNTIQQYLKINHMSQKALAEKLNVDPMRIHYWLKGGQYPTNKYLKLLNDTFNLNLKPKSEAKHTTHQHTAVKSYFIANNVKKAANKQNMTLTDVQKALKLPTSTIYNLEHKKCIDDLKALCPVLNCSVDQLLGLTDDEDLNDNVLHNCYHLGKNMNLSIDKMEIKAHLPYHTIQKIDQQKSIHTIQQICRKLNVSAEQILKRPKSADQKHVQKTIEEIEARQHPFVKRILNAINHQGINFEQYSALMNTDRKTLLQTLTDAELNQLFCDIVTLFHVEITEINQNVPLKHQPYQTVEQQNLDHQSEPDLLKDLNQSNDFLMRLQQLVDLSNPNVDQLNKLDLPHQTNRPKFKLYYKALSKIDTDHINEILFGAPYQDHFKTFADQDNGDLDQLMHAKSKSDLNQTKIVTSTINNHQSPKKPTPIIESKPASLAKPVIKTNNESIEPNKTIEKATQTDQRVTTAHSNDQRLNRLFTQIANLNPNQLLILNDLVNSWTDLK